MVAVIVSVLGCGSDKAPSGRGSSATGSATAPSAATLAIDAAVSPVPDLGAACGRFGEASCAAFDRCSPDLFALRYGTQDRCRAYETDSCSATLAVTGSRVTSELLDRCISVAATRSCPFFIHRLDECSSPPGALKTGEPCVSSAQCEGRVCTPGPAGNGCGTCGRIAEVGEPCPDLECVAGSRCLGGSCRKLRLEGESCNREDCSEGLRCDGVCKATASPRAVATVCKNADECVAGLECLRGKCGRAKRVSLGATCTRNFYGNGGLRPCEPGLHCDHDTCVRDLVVGDACSRASRSWCPLFSRCTKGTCQVVTTDICHGG